MKCIQEYIKEQLQELLKNPERLFDKDELAYLSLQGKNEMQIRDKVAWRLQRSLDLNYGEKQFIVRREWSPSGRSKVDLAIIKVETCQTIVLLEFKAHQFVNDETWPYAEFLKDTYKMYNMCEDPKVDNESDMYFIFLHSFQSHRQIEKRFKEAIAYANFYKSKNTWTLEEYTIDAIKEKLTKTWKSFYNKNEEIQSALYSKGKIQQHYESLITSTNKDNDNERKVKTQLKECFEQNKTLYFYPTPDRANINPEPCNVGESFGYEWYVASFIWGPYKRNDESHEALINLK